MSPVVCTTLLARLRQRLRVVLPVVLNVLGLALLFVFATTMLQSGTLGWDAWAYWRPAHGGPALYAGGATADGLGVFRYSPAFAQLVALLGLLDWPTFLFVWLVMLTSTWLFLAGRWSIAVLGGYIVLVEFYFGNVHLLLALAMVLGFRWPASWALVLLTKVTPGIGLLWFVLRREWRSLAVALLATAGVVIASIVLGGPELWRQWIEATLATAPSEGDNHLGVPLPVRLPLAALLVAWGALTNRRWTVVVAATLAMPTIWTHSVATLLGVVALWRGLPERMPSIAPYLNRARRLTARGAAPESDNGPS